MLVFHNTSAPPSRGDTAKYILDPNKVSMTEVQQLHDFQSVVTFEAI